MSTPASPGESQGRARRLVGIWFGSVALAALVVFPALTFAVLNWNDDPGLRWIDEVRARKFRAAELAGSGGRILVAGGSSAAFSVDAELLEAKLGRPAVNLGSHGALGLRFLLHDAKRVARAGDVVLLHLEYAQYRGVAGELGEFERKYLWTYDPRQFARLPPPLAIRQIYGNPWSDYVRSQERWSRRRRGERDTGNPEIWTHYTFVNLGLRGDLRAGVPGDEALVPAKLATPTPVSPYAAEQLEGFLEWCRRREVRVAAVLPGMLRVPPEEWATVAPVCAAVRSFFAERGVAVLGDAALLQWPREYLADTHYHANAAGRRLRTEALARDLAPLLGRTLPTADPAIFLVRARAAEFEPALAFVDRAVECRYLNATDLGHPWSLTPAQVADAVHRGTRVLYADDETAALLEAAGVRGSVVERKTSTLADWVTAYPQHVFVLATMGAVAASPADDALPEPFRAVLREVAPARAAILGTGSFAGVRASAHGEDVALAEQLRGESWQRASRFPLDLRAESAVPLRDPPRQWPILVAHEPMIESHASGLAVAVVDPALGIVVRRGVFVAGEHVDFTLRQVIGD